MPITLTAFDESPHFVGYTWEVASQSELARLLAHLVLGEHVHAAEILRGRTGGSVPHHADPAAAAGELRLPPKTDSDRYHRDGWIFQLISWLAVLKHESSDTIVRAPHMLKAHKGFDGIIIELDNHHACVIICEDKATESPRSTITSKVWPDLKQMEGRQRDRELISEVSTLLLQVADASRRKELAERILWLEKKHYRVAITADPAEATREGRRLLFNGYDGVAPGDPCRRRRGELFAVSNVRAWMDSLCAQIADALDEMGTKQNV